MTERYPRVRFYWLADGERFPCIQTSLSICFYMRRSHPELSLAVMAALEHYREAISPSSLSWSPDGVGYWKKLHEASWDLIREDLLHPRGATLWLRDTDTLTTDYEFKYFGRELEAATLDESTGKTCAVAFWLPTEYLESHGPARVRELALELGSLLPFNSGHAGLSFYFDESMLGIAKPLREVCLRYPGIDMPAVDGLTLYLGTRIKGAYWLTFLSAPVLDNLGGAANLRARLHSAGTRVDELSASKAVVTLGDWPEAGDLAHGHTLPAYRELAHVLEPWLYRAPRSAWSGFSDEDTRRWEHRFLD
jgi:hypothetical protein